MTSAGMFLPEADVEDALTRFRQHVNKPDTIFSTDHWLEPKLTELRPLLSDPITSEQAIALDDVLHGRHTMKDLINWLRSPAMVWADYFPYREQQHITPLRILTGNAPASGIPVVPWHIAP